MAFFKFLASRLLDDVKQAAGTTDLQEAAAGMIRGAAKRAVAAIRRGDVKEAEAILNEQDKGAEAIAGAIVKGTAAEKLVDPAIIHQPDRDDSPGGAG